MEREYIDPAIAEDIAKFEALLEQYLAGNLDEDEFRIFRLNNGIYGQRQKAHNQMVRIKIPYGQGIWPAFWMLGDDIDKAGWPKCGEIDIMENIGKEPAIVHGTIHGPGYNGSNGIGGPFELPAGQRFADEFHVFAVEWEPAAIRFYVDDHLYKTITPSDLPKGTKWVYKHPFFLLLNVAVGGGWPGNPDASTSFPQTMLVDYVRVYRRARSTH